MDEKVLIGREKEIAELERAYACRDFSLVVVKGRRRVGKTFLVNHVFSDRLSFKITGHYKKDMGNQLANFAAKLSKYSGVEVEKPKNWAKAFLLLERYLDSLPESKRAVVFIDELPWLDTRNSGFLTEFTDFVNDYACAKDNLLLIVCGSSSLWIDEKFTSDKGGLFNRQTDLVTLSPFNLRETEKYLVSRGVKWTRYDISLCYMAIGGMPYYWNKVDASMTMSENIDRLFFGRNAKLADEFDLICETLFARESLSRGILDLLVKDASGLTRDEISKKCGVSDGGVLTEALNGLKSSGLVGHSTRYVGGRKKTVYKIRDYFMLFHLRFVKGRDNLDPSFWRNSYDDPSRRAWQGLSFERLCFDHLDEIRRALGISGVLSSFYSWKSDEGAEDGAQIDLVIDRKDKTSTLVECKFHSQEFSIDKAYHANLVNKLEGYRNAMAPKKSLQLVLVSSFGLRRNEYSGIVSKCITLDDLFDF